MTHTVNKQLGRKYRELCAGMIQTVDVQARFLETISTPPPHSLPESQQVIGQVSNAAAADCWGVFITNPSAARQVMRPPSIGEGHCRVAPTTIEHTLWLVWRHI